MQVVGNKGSDVYASSGDPRLDLSVNCVRNVAPEKLESGIKSILALNTSQSLEDAFVLAFHARNVRGGKGERNIFQSLFATLLNEKPEIAQKCLELIPHYGCWNDVFEFAKTTPSALEPILSMVVDQFKKDLATPTGQSISLLAKWAPREHKHPDLHKCLAYRMFPFVKHHSSKMKHYRQMVSKLNARLNTVETYMCADRWDEIKPETVPGRAGKIYNRAFLNLPSTYYSDDDSSDESPPQNTLTYRKPDDPKRMACREHFTNHFAAAAEGKAKVHGAATLFPHEVVKKATQSQDDLTEDEKNHLRGVWHGFVSKLTASGGLGRSIFMSDFSGSMQCSSAGDIPYWVSMALGILGSEVCADEFKHKLMTFDSNPVWHTFPEDADLFAKIRSIQSSRVGQGLSTDFQKAMDLVLQTLKDQRVLPGQEPENLIVLTDMNWDAACGSHQTSGFTRNRYRHVVKTEDWQTHVEMIKEAFKRAGEDMWGAGQGFVPPRIVIWNLAASPQTDFHTTADVPGVALLSGWSPAQFEVLQKEGPRQLTAYEILRLELDDAKYDRVREVVRASVAGIHAANEVIIERLSASV